MQVEDVALVSHEPRQLESRRPRDGPGQSESRLARGRSGSMHADVDVYEHGDGDLLGRSRHAEIANRFRTVDDGEDSGSPLQSRQAPELFRIDDLIGEKDVVDAVRHHALGLAQLGAGDPTGACRALKTGDIRFEGVQVDDENGSGQLFLGAPDEIGCSRRQTWKTAPLTTSFEAL